MNLNTDGCSSFCQGLLCQLPAGHKGRHSTGAVTWDDEDALYLTCYPSLYCPIDL